MKNTLIALALLLAGTCSRAQQRLPYTAQEFALREVSMKEGSASQQQLQFNFRIYGKYGASQLTDESGGTWTPNYTLRFWLADAAGDTLVSDMADPSLQQRFSFFTVSPDTGQYRSYSFGHTVSFPYGAFRRYGQQTFSLWAQAQSPRGDIKLTPFKTGSYTVTVPRLHHVNEQQVQVKSAGVSESSTGVALKFNCQFLYGADELYTEGNGSTEVIFYTEFSKPDGSPVTLADDPLQASNPRSLARYAMLRPYKNTAQWGDLKLPYTLFYLPEGLQELNYAIHAVAADGTRRWENLYRGKVTIHMPPLYLARAVIKNIRVAERSYDVAAKDIPILNLFVSGKGSGGKGYPDLFWRFGSEGREILVSHTTHNSFTAADDSCFFQMMENERLSLGVYDYDVLSFNDNLGYFTFPVLQGDATFRQSKLRDEDVVDGEILIERKKRPATPTIRLYVKDTQIQGVSGYQIWGKVTDNSSLLKNQLFLRLPDGTHTQPAWQKIPMPADADFAGFVPAWDYPADAKVGLILLDKQYNMPFAQQYAKPDKTIRESRDVRLEVTPPQPAVQNGIHGLRLSVTAHYPAGMPDKNIFRFLYSLRETGGADLKPIAERGTLEGSPLCNASDCTFTLFVPYFLLREFSGKTVQALFGSEVQVAKNRFTVGKNETSLSLPVPVLQPAPTAVFTTNLKFKKNWSYVEIATEYNGQKQVLVKERAEDGKLTQEVRFPAEYVYGQDSLSLTITPYEFRTPQGEIRWTFTADALRKTGTLTLPKHPQAKKAMLKVH